MATSGQLTAARLHVTSPGPACTTRCPTRVTTFPRSLQTHSPARSWNWHIFDHHPAVCDAPDFVGSNGFRADRWRSARLRSLEPALEAERLGTYADRLVE